MPTQQQLELWTYHTIPIAIRPRLQVVKLYYQGWDKLSISRFLHVPRPTVDAWIARFEAEHFAAPSKKRGPKEPPQSLAHGWCSVSSPEVYPDAGEFRIWSLLAQPDISARTVGRITWR